MTAPDLVEIVNPNGRKGLVSATSKAARLYKRSPSTRAAQEAESGLVAPGPSGEAPYVEPPSRSGSTEQWRDWAVTHGGASPEDVANKSRDDLVAAYHPTDAGDTADENQES